MSKGTQRVRRWTIMGMVVVVVLGVGGPFVYIHYIEGPAPAKLSLQKTRRRPAVRNPLATLPPTALLACW